MRAFRSSLPLHFWTRYLCYSAQLNSYVRCVCRFFEKLRMLDVNEQPATFFSHQITQPNQVVFAKEIGWDRSPVRRKRLRRMRRTPTNFRFKFKAPLHSRSFLAKHVLFITLCTVLYFTTPVRDSPLIVAMDPLITYYTLQPLVEAFYKTGFYLSHILRNKLQHILNGNHTSATPPQKITLDDLIPVPTQADSCLDNLFDQHFKLSRNYLLQCSPSLGTSLHNPSSPLPTLTTRPKGRSGRRVTRFVCSTHTRTQYHRRLHRQFKGQRLSCRPQPLFSQNSARTDLPTPPPGGTPGSASAESKECKPHTHPKQPLSSGRGARLRRLRRQLYRQWRQALKGNISPVAPDNALVKGKLSLKAVKRYRQTGTRAAKMFKQLVLRKEREEGKKLKQKAPLATPHIPYATPIRVGTQNVQSMAELLKHQAVLDLITSRSLDVLFLTETHSTSYYQFKSQQHLFVVNGNKKDRYAGVTAVIHPRILPFLKEINQHTSRILQITFDMASGDQHYIGVYAPHNKHDIEVVKQPFWHKLEAVINKIPLPEPVFVLGDFNVRLQGRRRDEHSFLGPHIYGKGPLSIKNEEGSNRKFYTDLLSRLQFSDILTFKQPQLLRRITYRDKNPPPPNWSPFVLDPIGWTQFWDKIHSLPCNGEDNLVIATLIRNFLTNDWPTEPPIPPRIDPLRFQSLDRIITRSQWLPSICKVGSFLQAGFPSDHYLLELVIRVKLKARPQKTTPPTRWDYSAVTSREKRDFNLRFRDCYDALLRPRE